MLLPPKVSKRKLETRRENVLKYYQEVIPNNALKVINEAVSKYLGYTNFGEIYADCFINKLHFFFKMNT